MFSKWPASDLRISGSAPVCSPTPDQVDHRFGKGVSLAAHRLGDVQAATQVGRDLEHDPAAAGNRPISAPPARTPCPTGMPDSNIVANDRQMITRDLVRMWGLNTAASRNHSFTVINHSPSSIILAKNRPTTAAGRPPFVGQAPCLPFAGYPIGFGPGQSDRLGLGRESARVPPSLTLKPFPG